MFHFWFNTFFVKDEEVADLEAWRQAADIACGSVGNQNKRETMSVKTVVTRSHSDQSAGLPASVRVEKPSSEHQRLQNQLNRELLNRRMVSQTFSAGQSKPKSISDVSKTKESGSPNVVRKGCSLPPCVKLQPPDSSPLEVPAVKISTATDDKKVYKVLALPKSQIDRANKDKQNRLYPANFVVRLFLVLILFAIKILSIFSLAFVMQLSCKLCSCPVKIGRHLTPGDEWHPI
jgi:hypothetical protein